MEPYGALILAGGRAQRLGGVHKPGLPVGGVSMLERVLAAVPDAEPRVVVGPPQPVPDGVVVVRESPPGGGPVAALAAGLPLVRARWVAVLAGDLPFLTPAVVAALRASASANNGAVLVDDEDHDQYLAAVYAVDALGAPTGGSMRSLLDGMRLGRVRTPALPPPWFDCDDADDVRRARAWVENPQGGAR